MEAVECGDACRLRSAQNVANTFAPLHGFHYLASNKGAGIPMTSLTPTPDSAIRENSDGSLDAASVSHAFVTAGTAINESELPTIERNHQCDPVLLSNRAHWAAQSNNCLIF